MRQIISIVGQFLFFTSCITVVGYVLIGYNFHANFGPADDHGIIEYLGADRKLTIQEIPKLIQSSEIGTIGISPRFRLLYSPLMIIETFLWKDSAFLWYFSKFILFVLSFSLYWWIIKKYVGILTGFLTILTTLTLPFWGDIWTRLGPGEIYAVFGSALYVFSFAGLHKKLKIKILDSVYWVILLLGTAFAVGSKENFVILLLPTLYLMYEKNKTKTFTFFGGIISFLCMTFSLITAYFTLIVISKTGADEHGVSTGFIYRIHETLNQCIYLTQRITTLSGFVLPLIAILCTAALFFIYIHYKKQRRQFITLITKFSFNMILLFALVVSQIFFYAGVWPTSSRYDFPGMMALPIAGILLYVFIFNICRLIRLNSTYINIFHFLVFTLMIIGIVKLKFPVAQASKTNMNMTQAFMTHILTVVNITHESQHTPIIFGSEIPDDYEMIMAIPIYLQYYGVHNPLYLHIDYSNTETYSILEKQLSRTLIHISTNGNTYFSKWSMYQKGEPCFAVTISGPSHTECDQQVSFKK